MPWQQSEGFDFLSMKVDHISGTGSCGVCFCESISFPVIAFAAQKATNLQVRLSESCALNCTPDCGVKAVKSNMRYLETHRS